MSPSRFILRRAAVALAFVSVLRLAAQTTTPPPALDQEEPPIQLSPLIITADEDVGYQAKDTLAGSRMSTPLKDTPASISVLTSELIKDIGATDLAEAVAYATNVELELPDGNARFEFFNTFQIRGQAATVARNYFRWKLPTDNFDVERIEEARGPNSILFGIASAGGLLSSSTKQASTNRTSRRLGLTYGSYDMRRGTVDINQTSFDHKLGIRFNGLVSKAQGYQNYVFNNDNRAHVAIKYNLAKNTIIRGEYEVGKTHLNKADNQELLDSAMKWYYAGRPILAVPVADSTRGLALQGTGGNLALNAVDEGNGVFTNMDARGRAITQGNGGMVLEPALIDNANYRASLGGPGQTQTTHFNTYTASIDQKVGENTFLQLAFNHQWYDFSAWQAATSGGLKGDPNQFLRDGITPNPHAGQMYADTFWANRLREEKMDNLRLMVAQELDLGKWGEYRLAGLGEREWSNWAKDNYQEVWAGPDNKGAFGATSAAANRVLHRHYITEGDQSTYFASYGGPNLIGFRENVVDPSNPTRVLHTRMARQSGSDFDDPQEQDSYLLSGQAYYLKRRLVIAGGYRADTLNLHSGKRNLIDPVTGDFFVDNENNPRLNQTIHANTRTIGAVAHVLPWLSLRYNKSNSIELTNSGIRLLADNGVGQIGDNPIGEGQDYGFDVRVLDGKIVLGATRFSTSRLHAQGFSYAGTNDSPSVLSQRIMDAVLAAGMVTAAERELHRPDIGGSTFDVASTGYEFTLIANPTKNWRVQLNYSITDSVTDNVAPEVQAWAAREIPYFEKFSQTNPTLLTAGTQNTTIAQEIARWQGFNATNRSIEGINTLSVRPQKMSIVTSYAFNRGFLNGTRIGGAARHQSKQVIGYSTVRKEIVYGRSITEVNPFISYSLRPWKNSFVKGISLQLNVLNALNQHDPLVTRVADVNAAVLVPNRLVPQLPRTWRLSAEFSF